MTRLGHSLSTMIFITTIISFVVSPNFVEAQTYNVVISDHSFTPKILVARPDHVVRINIVNNGTKTHNFILPAFYIYTPNLLAKQSTWVQFTPDKTGKFPFYSDAEGDREAGLAGTMQVR